MDARCVYDVSLAFVVRVMVMNSVAKSLEVDAVVDVMVVVIACSEAVLGCWELQPLWQLKDWCDTKYSYMALPCSEIHY